jgi:hypothetical protein
MAKPTFKVVTRYGAWKNFKSKPAALRAAKAESKAVGRACVHSFTGPESRYVNASGGAKRVYAPKKQVACFVNGKKAKS